MLNFLPFTYYYYLSLKIQLKNYYAFECQLHLKY